DAVAVPLAQRQRLLGVRRDAGRVAELPGRGCQVLQGVALAAGVPRLAVGGQGPEPEAERLLGVPAALSDPGEQLPGAGDAPPVTERLEVDPALLAGGGAAGEVAGVHQRRGAAAPRPGHAPGVAPAAVDLR